MERTLLNLFGRGILGDTVALVSVGLLAGSAVAQIGSYIVPTAPPPSPTSTLAAWNLVEPSKTAAVQVTKRTAPLDEAVQANRTLASRVDANSNEVAGIRLPDIAVPLATYTGWNEYAYKVPYPAGKIADRDGGFLIQAADKAADNGN